MNLEEILAELRRERTMIEEAILALERLERASGSSRGRPPKWLDGMVGVAKKSVKRDARAPRKRARADSVN